MHTKLHLFTKGPIPYWWSYRANQLGTATGVIAQSLWFYVGINGSYTVKLDRNIDLLSGITRQSRQRCLKRLHDAGLIELSLLRGAYPIVTLLDVGQAGRRSQTPTSTTLETKTQPKSTIAGTGANFRKTNFEKQGYSHHEKQTTFNFS
ncbi:hypothetical protein ICN42_09405 [Polynucleobacter sp. 71A-WALBACH]|uniref:hypothetical protein n=1 Tax=Polynucleobacter sp. 71A-WALBACH TaxID=2689097 RepID=UPI001C0C97E2|nr:hypothetical protein [Polynucleobacter sp. 71A-WALBACH]MBU3594310.1 hypothetical protein [Polynucleobacter sp. 71A-WALBACH]